MSDSSHFLTATALTGLCAGAFIVAINANTLTNALGGLFFGLGFALLTSKTLDKLEQVK